jgi:hypothetical protein
MGVERLIGASIGSKLRHPAELLVARMSVQHVARLPDSVGWVEPGHCGHRDQPMPMPASSERTTRRFNRS